MGNCCSSSGAAGAASGAAAVPGDDDGAGDGEEEEHRGLFEELGIAPLRRPSPLELRDLWNELDADRSDALSRGGCRRFLAEASRRWGDGTWSSADDDGEPPATETRRDGAGAGGEPPPPPPPPSEALLNRAEGSDGDGEGEVTWEDARATLWDPPVLGVPSPTALLFQRAFLRRTDASADAMDEERAALLVRELLGSVRAPREATNAAVRAMLDGGGEDGGGVTFDRLLRAAGPAHASASSSYDDAYAGLRDRPRGDLPLDGTIRSFAPVRKRTRVEILNCGEAAMTSMLNAIKSATTEIMMSWWEFLPGLPAVRSAELGNRAWSAEANPDGLLPAILKSKAEAGVKIYVLLWDIVDVVVPTAPLVEHAVRSLGKLHSNISVASHPGLTVWTRTHHQKFVAVDRTVAILGGIDWTVGRWDAPAHGLFDPEGAVHPGADLGGGFEGAKMYRDGIEDWWERPERDVSEDRGEQATEPWQDVSLRVHGDAAADVALNFIQRWQHVRGDVMELFGDGLRDDMPEIPVKIQFLGPPPSDAGVVGADERAGSSLDPLGFASPGTLDVCRCQIVRSLGGWSGGPSSSETSHYEAWISAINSAERFIYIEQQYFISNMGEGDARNRVAEAVLNRVRHAVEASRPFRVYIVIPERVGSEAVNYFTRRTLLLDGNGGGGGGGGGTCLMSRIRAILAEARPGTYWHGTADAESVLSVCTLYSAGRSASGRWDVGDIMVHSKVLVCDDRVAVIGSANVNDRSFVGDGDSELGAVVWDEGDGGSGSGSGSDAAGAVADFRRRLWRQYLGLAADGSRDGPVVDPSSEGAYELWRETSRHNLDLLSSVTDWTPRDSIRTFRQWNELWDRYGAKSPAEKAAALHDPDRLAEMKGQLVRYPPKFLSDQRKRGTVEVVTSTFPLIKEFFL